MIRMLRSQYIFLVGGFALAASLFPSVLTEFKPDVRTSVIAAGVLTLYTLSFLAMKQPLSALGIALNAALWWVLLGQTL